MNPVDETDQSLISRALNGDQHAFTMLARRHGPRLARTVRAAGVPASDVEDVVQATFLSAWRALAEFDPKRPFSAWAGVIAVNRARDWLRQARARRPWRQAASLDDVEARDVADPSADVERLDLRDEARQVAAAIEALPDNLKRPLILVTVTGLTQREAGAALGISEKATEIRVRKAREQLAAFLAGLAQRTPG